MAATCNKCGHVLETAEGDQVFCMVCAMNLVFPPEDRESPLKIVGDHEVVGEIARGGMGVVYRARHQTTHREVALKMLLPGGSLNPDLRQRFHQEMVALAELDFPGILPLYETGEQDGLPYFTMKLALGGSLAEKLKSKTIELTNFKQIAELIAALAEAVHYAHQRGILHRDIKPANILFDENNQVFLGDFGLAKLLDSDLQATVSSAPLGTPCYMAPEVAMDGAKRATASSDIYGLGSVLYELLAGRPPFRIEGLGAILRKIADTEPETPSTLARGIPRDLEVICLTSMAKDPRKRYSSAAALAEDLRRWLHGEPISARRVGAPEKLWQWAKRRPLVAGLTLAIAVLLAGGGPWLGITNRRLAKALTDAKAARNSAIEREEFMLVGTFADDLENVGRTELLEAAWQNLDKAYENDPNMLSEPEGKLRRARLLNRWARNLQLQGKFTEAAIRSQQAFEVLENLPPSESVLDLRSAALQSRAKAFAEVGKFPEAYELVDQAAAESTNSGLGNLRRQAEIAVTKLEIVTRMQPTKSVLEGFHATGQEGVAAARQWHSAAPEDPLRARLLIRALRQQGKVYLSAFGRLDSATPISPDQRAAVETILACFHEAEQLAKNLCQLQPDGAEYQEELRDCCAWTAAVLSRIPGREDETFAALQQDLTLSQSLALRDPLNLSWQSDLADVHNSLAHWYGLRSNPEREEEHRRTAFQIAQALTNRIPASREWMMLACTSALRLGELHLSHGHLVEGKEVLGYAFTASKPYFTRFVTGGTAREGWTSLIRNIAEIWRKSDRPDEANKAFEMALDFCTQMSSGKDGNCWKRTAGSLWRRRADYHKERAEKTAELEANRQALVIRTALLRGSWQTAETESELRGTYQKIVAGLLQDNLVTEALQTAQEAIQLHKELGPLPGKRSEWASLVLEAIKAGFKAGGSEAETSRELARLTWRTLYEARQPESESDQVAAQELLKLIGDPSP